MSSPISLAVIAHNIRSAHNVGAFFRTCDGFGVEQLYLTGYTPYPATEGDDRLPHISQKLTQQIHKTAIGAETMVPFTHLASLETAMAELKAQGFVVWAIEQDVTSIGLEELPTFYASAADIPPKIALLMGPEVEGLNESALALCNMIVEIPMYGRKESFNVSVALGIALYGISELPRLYAAAHRSSAQQLT